MPLLLLLPCWSLLPLLLLLLLLSLLSLLPLLLPLLLLLSQLLSLLFLLPLLLPLLLLLVLLLSLLPLLPLLLLHLLQLPRRLWQRLLFLLLPRPFLRAASLYCVWKHVSFTPARGHPLPASPFCTAKLLWLLLLVVLLVLRVLVSLVHFLLLFRLPLPTLGALWGRLLLLLLLLLHLCFQRCRVVGAQPTVPRHCLPRYLSYLLCACA